LCPPRCEGLVMAFIMSAISLAFIVSGYLGVALASYVGVTGDDFSGLPRGLLIQAVCTLLPIFWSSCILDVKSTGKKKRNSDVKSKGKKKDN
ncbi:probable folate-biopterin transporter 7, partial [Olea europaea subsp. europaea]